MNRSRFLSIALIGTITTIIYFSFWGNHPAEVYVNQVTQERREKDQFMKQSDDSPFKAEAREKFNGLRYFEPDPDYKVGARLVREKGNNTIEIATNDGKIEAYLKFGYAEFLLNGHMGRLLILKLRSSQDPNSFFIPFGDKTSAIQTYGAGRYIDLEFNPGSQSITLDFNLAYNPYCAYNEAYSCPLPPRENLLKIAILAGEKNYEK